MLEFVQHVRKWMETLTPLQLGSEKRPELVLSYGLEGVS